MVQTRGRLGQQVDDSFQLLLEQNQACSSASVDRICSSVAFRIDSTMLRKARADYAAGSLTRKSYESCILKIQSNVSEKENP